jgi:hypothetical protein
MNIDNFIEEILIQLIEEANKIRINASDDFETGKLFGYYFAISKIMNQAETFGVFDKLPESLQTFEPESLLGR